MDDPWRQEGAATVVEFSRRVAPTSALTPCQPPPLTTVAVGNHPLPHPTRWATTTAWTHTNSSSRRLWWWWAAGLWPIIINIPLRWWWWGARIIITSISRPPTVMMIGEAAVSGTVTVTEITVISAMPARIFPAITMWDLRRRITGDTVAAEAAVSTVAAVENLRHPATTIHGAVVATTVTVVTTDEVAAVATVETITVAGSDTSAKFFVVIWKFCFVSWHRFGIHLTVPLVGCYPTVKRKFLMI